MKQRPMGELAEAEARRLHLEGGSYAVIPGRLEPERWLITINSTPHFIGITKIDDLQREVLSLNFSSQECERSVPLVQAFGYRYEDAATQWASKVTIAFEGNYAEREMRTLEPLTVANDEIRLSNALEPLNFPEFGQYDQIEQYSAPEIEKLLTTT